MELDEERERLIDILLHEELSGAAPPDLTDRVLTRAFPPVRRFQVDRVLLAASVLLAFAIGATLVLWPSYPQPRASGQFVVLDGGPVQRGARLRSGAQPAVLELGGYSKIELRPGTTLRIAGQPYAESVFLEAGTVQSTIEPGTGTFTVETPIGTVSVAGTEFLVQVTQDKETRMLRQRLVVSVLAGLVLVAAGAEEYRLSAGEEVSFLAADEKKTEVRGGTVIGVVTARGDNWIEIKADGEEKGRRYVPNWVGGAPAQGGGLDKAMLKLMGTAPVGARVKIEWKFEERPRVVKLEVIKKDGDKKDQKKDGDKNNKDDGQKNQKNDGNQNNKDGDKKDQKKDGDQKNKDDGQKNQKNDGDKNNKNERK